MNILEKLYYGEIRGTEIEVSEEYKNASARELKIYEKIKETYSVEIPYWMDSLQVCISEMDF